MITITKNFLFKLRMSNVLPTIKTVVLPSLNYVFTCKSKSFVKMLCTNIAVEQTHDEKLEALISEISNGNHDIENKLRILMLEIEVMKQDGRLAPELSYLKKKHWEELLQLSSKHKRAKFILYLFKTSKTDENEKIKKEKKKLAALEIMEWKKQQPPEPITQQYTLTGNSMFVRIYDKSMDKFYNHKLHQALMYGEKIVIDCSYDKFMTKKEASDAAKQLTHLFAENRTHVNPYDVYFCNFNKESPTAKQLYRNIPTMEAPDFPLNLHKESYLDIFPKEKIVYLTPHCKIDLKYNHDDIYVIGCMVDKGDSQPYSLAKAKELGLRIARLPLDSYLSWKPGSGKSLTINQACKILLDMKLTGDWNYALRHVPRRKILDFYNNSKFDSAVDEYLKKSNLIDNYNQPIQTSESRTCFSGNFKKPPLKKKVLKKNYVASLYED